MSSDAEILAPRDRLGEARSERKDPRRWAALAVFIGYERRKTRRDGSPLVELRMFGQRGFAAAVTHALWYQLGVFLLAFLLMLALPARRGHSGGPSSV